MTKGKSMNKKPLIKKNAKPKLSKKQGGMRGTGVCSNA
jgi:hypothetical protein